MSSKPPVRGGVYIDGFNLYHAIDDLGKPFLKWLNLMRLARKLAIGHAQTIDRLVFCTAYFPDDFGKRKRHEAYNSALRAVGADIVMGHSTKAPANCRSCGRVWFEPREKESDINLALSIYDDVVNHRIDVVFLISADTDQASTLKFLSRNYPNIKRIVVTPPGRPKSTHLKDLAHSNMALSELDIELALFPAMTVPETGRPVFRPNEYMPPEGWVHPDDRPG